MCFLLQLEKLKDQYENQMDSLRGELESERRKRQEMMQSRLPEEYNKVSHTVTPIAFTVKLIAHCRTVNDMAGHDCTLCPCLCKIADITNR